MPKRLIGSNAVLVLPANLLAFDRSNGFEIGYDPLNGAFGYPYLQRHLSKH